MRCRVGKESLKPMMEGKRWAVRHVTVSIYKSRREGAPEAVRWEAASSAAGVHVRRWTRGRAEPARPPARRLPSNPRHRAAPSSSRGEDEVEGLALCGGDVGVPQVHHEDHAGTFLWGTWVGCKHGVRLRSRGSAQCSPRCTGVTGSPVPPAGSSPPGLLWAIRPQGFPSQGGEHDAELTLLAAVPWSRAGSCCCAIAALPAPRLRAGLRFPIPRQG